MAAVDTNVLLRYLMEDEPSQVVLVRQLIRHQTTLGLRLFVSFTVLLETEWVLRTGFGMCKAEVLDLLDELARSETMAFDSPEAMDTALDLYRQGSADFADCLHLALVALADECPMYTFDRKAARMLGAAAMQELKRATLDLNALGQNC